MGEIEVAGEKIRLNFWKQMTPPFLVNKTSFQLFEFLSKSKEQELITDYQDETNERLKAVSKEINDLNVIINSKTLEEVEYKNILDKSKKVLEIDLEALEAIYGLLETLIELKSNYSTAVDKVTEQEVEFNKLLDKNKAVTFFPVEGEKMLQTLNSYTKLSDLYKLAEIDKDIVGKTVSTHSKALTEKTTMLSAIKSILDEIQNINKQINDYNIYLKKYKDTQVDELSYSVEIKQIKVDLAEVEKELNTFDVCPLCGSGLNHKH